MDYIWPIKCVKVESGVLCLYNYAGVPPSFSGDISMQVVVVDGGMWGVVMQHEFFVPVDILGVSVNDSVTLFLGGSSHEDMVAEMWASIPLGVRTLTKIALIIEMESDKTNEKQTAVQETAAPFISQTA